MQKQSTTPNAPLNQLNYQATDAGFLLVLTPGQKVIASLTELIKSENIEGATFTAVGAVKDVEIAYYDMLEQAYVPKKFPLPAEVISFTGNLGWTQGQPVVHGHIALGGADYAVYGGHLKEAEVTITLEVFITETPFKIERTESQDFKTVKVIDLKSNRN